MELAQKRAHILYNAIVISILIVYGLELTCSGNLKRYMEFQLKTTSVKLAEELWNHRNLEFNEWSTQVKNHLDLFEQNSFVLESSSSVEWSLADSWLFARTVFTTIGLKLPSYPFFSGLGDYVPRKIHHTVLFGGYILLGLVLVTMVFSSMEEKIAHRFYRIKQMVRLVEREERKEL